MRRADNGPPDAFTVGELCERTGKEARVVRVALGALKDISRDMGFSDALDAAREFVVRELARALRPAFLHGFSSRRPAAAYVPTPAQIGARALSNRCLAYLGTQDDDAARALLLRQQRDAALEREVVEVRLQDRHHPPAGRRGSRPPRDWSATGRAPGSRG